MIRLAEIFSTHFDYYAAYSAIVFSSDKVSLSNSFMYISIPIDVFKKIMYKTEINGVLLSQLTLGDQDEYSGDELLKIKE